MGEQEASLKQTFLSAKQKQEKLHTLEPRSSDFRENQNAAINDLERCRKLITQTALYSTNETLDDISTPDLQYLTVDYLLADLLLRSYDEERMNQLKSAAELLDSFLARLDHYEILSPSDRKIFERYRENKTGFSTINSSNPEERRNRKILRFQEEKALKSKLKLLRDQSIATNVDDETMRSLYTAEISLSVHQTFQSLDMISQEYSILSQMRHIPTSEPNGDTSGSRGRQDGRAVEQYSDKLDGPLTMGGLGRRGGPLLNSKGKPLQPFTLTDKRTQLQNGVFRSGHNLPTMSIDEYLEEERKRGGIIEGGGNANAPQEEPDEDNMDLVDAATMKAREWDEFVEANPKGAGNTLNRG